MPTFLMHWIDAISEATLRSDLACTRMRLSRRLFFHGDRFHLDRLGLGVQCPDDFHLLSREFFRRLLIAQGIGVLPSYRT